MDKLCCIHNPKIARMKFSCKVSGDYELVLCEKCANNEDRRFLIEEQPLEVKY